MASMEENFPRGGTQKKPSEGKAPRQPIEQDNLFDVSSTPYEEGSQKRKRIQEDKGKQKKFKAEKKEAIKANAKDFELLTVEALSEGMLLLGCVKESNDFELMVSLPNGLTGFVQVTHICDAYSKMLNEQVATEELLEDLNSLSDLYPPGMLVRCSVTSMGKTMDGHQSIKLSINPKDVNKALNTTALRSGMLLSGLVSSVEDHGYLIDIGVSGAKAFLPLQKSQSYIKSANKGAELKIGQYLNCLIEEVKNNGRIVRLSISQSEVAAAIATEEQNWTLSNLLPGLVVKAQVQKVTPYGIALSFLSSFTGIVDFMHLDPKKAGNYSQSQTIKACILSVHPTSKAVRLTLRQVFLQPGSVLGQLASSRIGMVVGESVVKSFHAKTGAIFELDDGTLAFARLKHLSDTKKSFKPGTFKTGSKHRCRIIDYSLMDELALLSLKRRIIAAPFLRYQDICPGHVVEGKVLALKPLGMQVKVTDHIRGLVPHLHLADVLLKKPEKKYSVGREVKCRVLISNPEEKKLILTLKKTLVTSKFPVLTSYKAAKPGLITHGFIVCAREFGCIVKFYNDVKGLVPKSELSSEPIPSPEKVFYKGQVVKVIVLKCEPEQEKLLLSFKLMSRPGPQSCLQSHITCLLFSVQMVDVKVLRKKDNGLKVSILSDNVSAHLPTMHLSDHVVNCKLLYHWLQEGDILHRVMCLSDKGGHITLCRKPALISAVQEEQVVRSFSEIQPGMQLAGYVRNIMSYGVFVEFPFGLAGLAPKAAMSDKFVTDTKDHFVVGQTVVANVTSMDEEKQRILLCLKLSEVGSEDPDTESFSLLSQCFEEMKEIRGIMSRRSKFGNTLSHARVMTGRNPLGLSAVNLLVFIDKSLVAGQKARVLVLHVDALKSAVHVSLREELLSLKAKRLMENSQHPAVVQHVAEEFAIASLVKTGQLTAIPVASHFNDTFRFDSEKLKVGQAVSVTLKTMLMGDHGVLLAVQGPAKKRALIRSRKESETVEEGVAAVRHSLCLGDVVKGTVKSVRPTYVTVAIDDKLTGSIHTSQILDDVPIGTFPTSRLKAGQKVTARVIGGRDMKTHRYLPITHPHFTQSIPELSIRPSDLKGDGSTALSPEGDNPSERLRPYKAGQTVTCFVKKYNTIKTWLEVEITPEIRGRVLQLLLSLNPKVLKHPEKSFKNGQALSATVTGTDASETNLCLSLTGVHSLVEGTITLGTITKVTPHVGLTIALPFGKIGKASIFHLSDSFAEQPLENFSIGKLVSIEHSVAVRIFLLPPLSSRTNPKSKNKVEDPEITCVEDVREGQLVRGYVKSVKQLGETKHAEAPRLQVSSGFTWDEGLNALEVPVSNRKEESSDSEEEDDAQKKQTKKEQEQEKQRVEKELSKLEAALMDPNRQPQTADDFDRLVLSNPSSSILWLQYMAFHLQATEIEKARVVAERALKTISFREEQEKLNVWVALLNLENMYGTEETLMKVFERAVQYNEPLKVFQHLADIYASSEKYQQADDLYNTMLKRFRQEKSVWLKYATFLLKRGQVEATHRLLERALKGLPDKEHVDVISKFAQLEFHFGDPEHAKAIFESTLSSYPKRTDVWSIYIDMMIKHGSQKEVRDIFERVIHLSLAAKRMKFFFKRYLDYEKKYGTSETIQAVKVAALEYVESKSSLAES
uniref:Protein RRP5 homolog n=1 Tax=Chelydra serpentina TaxID=8475 RepID=A0A8C3T7Q7_CHESE